MPPDLVPAAILASGGMNMTQIEYVTKRHERHADDRQNGFFDAMRNGKRTAHEGQARHRNHKGCGDTMPHRAPANGNTGNEGCSDEADPMDIGRKE